MTSNIQDLDYLTEWLGKPPSPEKLKEIEERQRVLREKWVKLDALFVEWFESMEGFAVKSERFYDDFDFAAKTNDYKIIENWLKAAYHSGYSKAEENL